MEVRDLFLHFSSHGLFYCPHARTTPKSSPESIVGVSESGAADVGLGCRCFWCLTAVLICVLISDSTKCCGFLWRRVSFRNPAPTGGGVK